MYVTVSRGAVHRFSRALPWLPGWRLNGPPSSPTPYQHRQQCGHHPNLSQQHSHPYHHWCWQWRCQLPRGGRGFNPAEEVGEPVRSIQREAGFAQGAPSELQVVSGRALPFSMPPLPGPLSDSLSLGVQWPKCELQASVLRLNPLTPSLSKEFGHKELINFKLWVTSRHQHWGCIHWALLFLDNFATQNLMNEWGALQKIHEMWAVHHRMVSAVRWFLLSSSSLRYDRTAAQNWWTRGCTGSLCGISGQVVSIEPFFCLIW